MSGYVLGKKSLSFCPHVDPRMMRLFVRGLELSDQDAGFHEPQSRTVAEESALVAAGKSHTLKSHHIIDINPAWAAPGFSGAGDAVPWNGTSFVWEWPRCLVVAAAMRRASMALGIPATWGGCWDRLLSEIPGDGSAAAMKAASDDYIRRHRAMGNANPFVDGPHFEFGRN